MTTESEPPARRGQVRAGANVWVRPAPVRVQLLTDPWSVWCWGFEPVRRAIELRYPSLHFDFLLGGMFPRMPDPRQIGFDVERFFAVVQRTTGMPIESAGVKRDPANSTYPACRFVHAVQLVAPQQEMKFLRRLREAAYLDGLNISKQGVAERVAGSLGIPKEAFRRVLDDGAAEEAFQKQLQTVHAENLHGYPTVLLTHGDRQMRIEGFQTLPGLLGVAQSLSGRAHPPSPDPPMEAIFAPGERVATREVAEVLGVSLERAFERLVKAQKAGQVSRERHPTGDTWTVSRSSADAGDSEAPDS